MNSSLNPFAVSQKERWRAFLATVNSPSFRRALCVCLVVALVAVAAQAQQPVWGQSNTLETTSDNASTYVFGTARWPIIGAMSVIGWGVNAWTDRGRKVAYGIWGAAAVWSLMPFIISIGRSFIGN